MLSIALYVPVSFGTITRVTHSFGDSNTEMRQKTRAAVMHEIQCPRKTWPTKAGDSMRNPYKLALTVETGTG